ncbi:MAG: hypothetical protein AAGA87_10255 [Pseudomonadota bacterium]
MLTKDQLIREVRARGATLPAVLLVYGLLVATMVGTALAIV